MTQYELIEQIINNLDFNFTTESKIILIDEILENLINELQFNLETDENKKDFNTLNTIQLSIRKIIKRNEVNE